MTADPSRRFTDREVAVVLRSAVEIDDREGAAAGGGLSLEDLRDVAREVGISAGAIDRAVQRMDAHRRLGPGWTGAPLVRKAVRAVPGALDREAIARLVRVVDERADSAGSISEALGSVRWTASDRFRSSLVTITPGAGDTSIQVVEKVAPRLRRVFHLLPAAWATMLVTPLIASAGLGPVGAAAGVAASVAAGAGIGRAVWTALSARSARRVDRLATALAEEAGMAAKAGSARTPSPEA